MSKKKSKSSFFVFIFTFVLILMCVCVCICINVFGVGAGGNSIRACRINPGLVDPTNPHPSPDTRSVQHWYKYFLYLCTHKYEYKSQVKQKSTPTKITHPVQCGLVCMCGCVVELWRTVWQYTAADFQTNLTDPHSSSDMQSTALWVLTSVQYILCASWKYILCALCS